MAKPWTGTQTHTEWPDLSACILLHKDSKNGSLDGSLPLVRRRPLRRDRFGYATKKARGQENVAREIGTGIASPSRSAAKLTSSGSGRHCPLSVDRSVVGGGSLRSLMEAQGASGAPREARESERSSHHVADHLRTDFGPDAHGIIRCHGPGRSSSGRSSHKRRWGSDNDHNRTGCNRRAEYWCGNGSGAASGRFAANPRRSCRSICAPRAGRCAKRAPRLVFTARAR